LVVPGVASCSVGAAHSLFVKNDRSLWTTGANSFGQLGIGSSTDTATPQEIAPQIDRAYATANGILFTTQAGADYGIGLNRFGLLGFSPPNPYRPSPALLAQAVSEIDATPDLSFYRSASGALWSSRGLPADGVAYLGIIADDVVRLIHGNILKAPGADGSLSSVVSRTLFLRADGSLWGAGDNPTGALGTGDGISRSDPVRIATGVSEAGATWNFTLFLKPDLTLWRVGAVINTTIGYVPNPADFEPVLVDRDVTSVCTSYRHALYLKSDGTLWGLGDSQNGQLGVTLPPPTTVTSAPIMISTEVTAMAVSARHSLFLKTDGGLWGCGFNGYGQLGSTIGTARPVTLLTSGVVAVAAGPESTFVIKTDGSLWACGNNQFGQLGAGSSTSVSTPVQVATGVVKAIPSATGENTFFFKADGSLWGMGRNDLGQLGLGHVNTPRTPVRIRTQGYALSASGLHTLFLHDPVSITAPAIVTQPVSQTFAFGDLASITAVASGANILTYQWYRGASGDTTRPIAAADDATLRLPAFAGTATYWVRVANAAGSVDSDSATITVIGGGSSAFRTWAETAGLTGSRLSISADADGDGLANLLEYAFGTSPADASSHGPFAPELVQLPDGDFLVLTHRRRKATDAAIAYERSADLQTWETATLFPTVVDSDADGDGLVEEISVALPLSPDSARDFLRVKVSPNPPWRDAIPDVCARVERDSHHPGHPRPPLLRRALFLAAENNSKETPLSSVTRRVGTRFGPSIPQAHATNSLQCRPVPLLANAAFSASSLSWPLPGSPSRKLRPPG
jgi:alpha-tubulin suppressor-like RCC1 family protein